MTELLGGFITEPLDTLYYRVGKKQPEEGGLDTSFFVGSAVKSIGPVYRQVCAADSTELPLLGAHVALTR